VAVLAPDNIQNVPSGLGDIANVLGELAVKLQATKEARLGAKAKAAYNDAESEYELSIFNKDPNEKGVDFVNGRKQHMLNAKSRILEGLPRGLRDRLNDQFVVWDQRGEAQVGMYAIKRTTQLYNEEMPYVIEMAARNKEPEILAAYIKEGNLPESQERIHWADYKELSDEINKKQALEELRVRVNNDPRQALVDSDDGKFKNLEVGTQIYIKDLATSIIHKENSGKELLAESRRISKTKDVSNYIDGKDKNPEASRQAIVDLAFSKDAKDRKLGKKLHKREIVFHKPPSEQAETIPFFQYESYTKIADDISGRKVKKSGDVVPIDEQLKITRFDKEQVSQEDHITSVNFSSIEIPPESQEAFRAIVYNFKPQLVVKGKTVNTTFAQIQEADSSDYPLIERATRSFYEWAGQAKPEDLTPSKMADVGKEIVAWAKAGGDPGDIKAYRDLSSFMESNKLPLNDLKEINQLLDAGHRPSHILDGFIERYPNANY